MKNSAETRDLLPEQAEAKRHTIELKGGDFIIVEETEPGIFIIIDNSIIKKDEKSIGFRELDDSVQNLDDEDSDLCQCLGISEHLQWEDVEFTPEKIKAPSLDRLKEALEHMEITAYCPDDI